MFRNAIGAVLALVGAAAAVLSPFFTWHDGRRGKDYEVGDLFTGITADRADLWASLLLPLGAAALITIIGLVLRSRLVVALAGVVVLGFTILWIIRQGQAADGLTVGGDGALGWGVAFALGGGLLLLLAAALMAGRHVVRTARTPESAEPGGGYSTPEGPRHARRTPPDIIPGPDRPEYPGYPEQPPGRQGPPPEQRP